MELRSFQELQDRFELEVDQAFAKWQVQLVAAEARGDVKELYYLTRYRLPEEVQNWVQEEAHRSGHEVAGVIRSAIACEEETHHCERCEHHQEVLERVQIRLDNIPMVESPMVGPYHLFNQAFSAFGLIGVSMYVGTSYVSYDPAWFEPTRIVVSLMAGLACGMIAHRKYHRVYRQEFKELGDVFLKEHQRRIREWFDQIITFSEGEIEFYAG